MNSRQLQVVITVGFMVATSSLSFSPARSQQQLHGTSLQMAQADSMRAGEDAREPHQRANKPLPEKPGQPKGAQQQPGQPKLAPNQTPPPKAAQQPATHPGATAPEHQLAKPPKVQAPAHSERPQPAQTPPHAAQQPSALPPAQEQRRDGLHHERPAQPAQAPQSAPPQSVQQEHAPAHATPGRDQHQDNQVVQPLQPATPQSTPAQPKRGEPRRELETQQQRPQPPAQQPTSQTTQQPLPPRGAQQTPQPAGTPPAIKPMGHGAPSTQSPAASQQAPAAGAAPPQPSPAAAQAGRIEEMRAQRKQRVENNGQRTIIEEPDHRLIVRENGLAIIRHDETERFRLTGANVRVDQRGGETITVVRRPGDVEIVTVVDANGRLLRRTRRTPDGREFVLIDNRPRAGFDIGIGSLVLLPPPRITIPRDQYIVELEEAPPQTIIQALESPPVERLERAYSLDEIRYSLPVRDRMRRIDLDTINFDTGSWQITDDQSPRLEQIAAAINGIVRRNPSEMFLIEGHTDAVGSDEDNLSLSDRRAESVALILTQNFQVPPENLTTQGYGSHELKVPTQGPSRENRRVTIRRITPLLAGSS